MNEPNLDPAVGPRYRRLVISSWDISEALTFADSLVAIGALRHVDSSETIRSALTIATIVSYGRPFKRSQGSGTDSRLEIESLRLQADDLILHERLLRMRDKAFAHSDADETDISLSTSSVFGIVPSLRDPRVPWLLEEAERYRDHIKKVDQSIGRELAALGVRMKAINMSHSTDS